MPISAVPEKVLIIGCGYVGLPLALDLKNQGHEVSGWVRSEAGAERLGGLGLRRVIVGSVGDEDVWRDLEPFDLVVHCASSGGGGAAAYDEVFRSGAQWMGKHQIAARRILVSSTSVYGQTEGERVTEESPTEPSTETGKILREAERIAVASGTMVARAAGIYGLGRGALFRKLREGKAVIEGDGSRWINQIHQRDLVAALVHLAEEGKPGEIYNASDDEPVTLTDFYAWCAELLQRPMPPHGPVSPARKRGVTSKRVANGKLKALGWGPVYPTFREGLKSQEILKSEGI